MNLELTNSIKVQYILKDTTTISEKIMDQITNGIRKTKIKNSSQISSNIRNQNKWLKFNQ